MKKYDNHTYVVLVCPGITNHLQKKAIDEKKIEQNLLN